MRGRKKIAAAAVAGVLALAAGATAITAIAAPGGGPLGLLGGGEDRRTEEAQALGKKLGVDPARVSRALEEVHRERHAARQAEMAKALAEKLDVPPAEAERALQAAFAAKPQTRRDRADDQGERRDRGERERDGGPLVDALAKELGKSRAEVKKALDEIHQERFEAKLAEAVKEGQISEDQAKEIRERAKEDGGGGFGPPHGGPGGFGGPGGPGGHGGPEGHGGPDGPDDDLGGPGGPPPGGNL